MWLGGTLVRRDSGPEAWGTPRVAFRKQHKGLIDIKKRVP